jgi:hypothetical protein
MKRTHKVAVGLIGAVSLGLSVAAANAHQGPTGGGMHHGATGGSGPMGGGMHRGATGAGPAGPAAAQQLMTPEERTAIINKMRSATTPEERQKIAAENHAEMQKRAAEKGVSLSEQRGPRAGYGRHAAPATDTQTR